MAEDADVTTLYLRNMPGRLVREAKARAARRGSTLAALVTEALAQSLSSDPGQSTESEDYLRASMEWYERNRERLAERFHNEYVAIVDGAVLDHDENFEPLAMRVFERVGVRPVFMPRVARGAERARVRSPRRRKA